MMVYIGNIIKCHEQLETGFQLQLFYKSGRQSTIYKTDILVRCNGDLQVIRNLADFSQIVVIDCNEVESLCITKKV